MTEPEVNLKLICTGDGTHRDRERELAVLRPGPYEFGFAAATTQTTLEGFEPAVVRKRAPVAIFRGPGGHVFVRPDPCPYCGRPYVPQRADLLFAVANSAEPDPHTGLVVLDLSVSSPT